MSEVEQYEREAAETRARLRESVEEMQRRLTPANIIENAKQSVRETVRSTVRDGGGLAAANVGRSLASNPLVLAGIGVAIALIVYRRASATRASAAGFSDDEYSAYGEGDSYVGDRDDRGRRSGRRWTQVRAGVASAGERLGAAGDRLRAGLDSARSTAAERAEVLRDRAGTIGSLAGERLRAGGETVRAAAASAGEAASGAMKTGVTFAQDNPVALVGVAVAAGAALALLASNDDERADYGIA